MNFTEQYCMVVILILLVWAQKDKQAQESLAAVMSLGDISGIVTSWADFYKNSTPNFNFSL